MEYVRQLETNQPIQMDKNRRAALVSAKLIFLVPRQHDEPLEMYLGRVKEQFTLRCQGVAG